MSLSFVPAPPFCLLLAGRDLLHGNLEKGDSYHVADLVKASILKQIMIISLP